MLFGFLVIFMKGGGYIMSLREAVQQLKEAVEKVAEAVEAMEDGHAEP